MKSNYSHLEGTLQNDADAKYVADITEPDGKAVFEKDVMYASWYVSKDKSKVIAKADTENFKDPIDLDQELYGRILIYDENQSVGGVVQLRMSNEESSDFFAESLDSLASKVIDNIQKRGVDKKDIRAKVMIGYDDSLLYINDNSFNIFSSLDDVPYSIEYKKKEKRSDDPIALKEQTDQKIISEYVQHLAS